MLVPLSFFGCTFGVLCILSLYFGVFSAFLFLIYVFSLPVKKKVNVPLRPNSSGKGVGEGWWEFPGSSPNGDKN